MTKTVRRANIVGTLIGVAVLVLGVLPLAATAGASSSITAFSNIPNYGYAVSDSAGNIYVDDYSTGVVSKVTANGTVSTVANFGSRSIWGMTINGAGDLYVACWCSGSSATIYQVTPAGVTTTLFRGPQYADLYGMAVDSAGNLYTSNCFGTILKTTPSGSWSTFATHAGGCGLAVGANGTLYSSDGSSSVYAITAGGVVTKLTSSLNDPFGLAYDSTSGVLYVANSYGADYSPYIAVAAISPSGVVSTAVAQSALPPSGGYTNSDYEIAGLALDPSGNLWLGDWYSTSQLFEVSGVAAPLVSVSTAPAPTNLVTTRSTTTMTVSWRGGVAPYTCTLLYGFTTPSSYVVRASSTSCTFGGLDPATPYGVRVSSYQGASAQIFSSLVRTSITCVRDRRARRVSGFNPRCPAGWRLRA